MAYQTFRPRTKLNYEQVRQKLRSEFGSAVQSEAEIASVLADVDKDLEGYDAEIYHLQSRMIHLQNQRERLEEYKSCLRSLICPVRKLPNEILARIFDYSCNTNEVLSRDLKRMPALALSGVCSRWRVLAKSFPVLWSRLQIELQEGSSDPRDKLILQLYIERSEQFPLNIEIYGVSTEHNSSSLDVIISQSHRWQRLLVHRVATWTAMHARDLTHFPLLQVLDFSNLLFSHSTMLDYLQKAPMLSDFWVWRTSISRAREQKFPWKQITCLQFRYPLPGEGLSELFETCSNLKELHIVEDKDKPLPRSAPAVTAPALVKLALSATHTAHPESLADTVFASLTCPSLTSLLIDRHRNLQYNRVWPKDSLHDFLSRSSCRLATLSIKRIPLSDVDLRALLLLLPSLLDLTIDDTDVPSNKSPLTSHFVRSLHAFRGNSISSAAVPKLQSLSLTFSGSESDSDSDTDSSESFNDKEFVDMVSSRWVPDLEYASQAEVECLRSVVMRFTNRDVDEEVYKPLTYLEKAGMRVVVIGENS